MIVDGIYLEQQLANLSCANILQMRYATNYASASRSACVIAIQNFTSEIAAIFQNVRRRLAVNKLSFPNNQRFT